MNLFKQNFFSALIAVVSLFITLTVTVGTAQAGNTTLSLSTVLTAKADPAITVTSATSITIESDKLTSATSNLVEFRVSVSSDIDHPIRGVVQSSDAPKDSSASASTISPPTNSAQLTYTIPVDQVPFGSSPVTFTYQVKSFVTPSGENTVTNCEGAKTLAMNDPGQFKCDEKMLTVTVNPISPPDPVNLTVAIAAQSNSAVSTSGTTVTISSDLLANDSNNAIAFDVSAVINNSTDFAIDDLSVTSTHSGSTSSSSTSTAVSGSSRTDSLVFTANVDKVAFDSTATSFTITVQSYTDLSSGGTITSCAGATSDSLNTCQTKTITVNVVPGIAPDPVNLTVDITAQSNSAVTSSGTTVTIDSDSLAAETGNLVAFDLSAMISNNDSYTIDSLIATSTSSNAGSATLGSITTSTNTSTTPSTRTDSRVYTLPIDKVAVGSAAASFTITVTAFTDLSASDTVSSCAAATSDSLNSCVSKTITVMVDPTNGKSARTAALANNFLRRRARNTLNAEPGLSDQLNNDGGENIAPVGYGFTQNGNSFDVNLSGNKSFGFGYGAEGEERFNLWFKSSIARITEAGVKQKFSVGHVGLGYKVNSDLVVGALAQFDNAREVDGVATVKGTGWLVGPYLAANVHEKLVFEGRVALGASSNKISPLGTYTDKFTTRRFLARGKISGHFQQGEWKVAPNFAVQYMRENRAAYVDSVGVTIPSSNISLGQFVFGTNFSTAFETKNGTTVSPSVGFKGLWNFADTGFFDPATGLISSADSGDVSARFDAGVLFDNNDGLTLSLNGFYDGIGAKNYEGFGGTAKFLIKF